MDANLPNMLTLSRVLATPVVCLLLLAGTATGSWLAFAVYFYACVTDFFDGYLARVRSQQSSFGRFLDPVADKLLVASILLILVGIDRLNGVDILAAVVILCREILVSGLREHLAQLQVGVPVTRLAKWKTTIQMIALGLLVAGDVGPSVFGVTMAEIGAYGLWLAAALTLITGYDYLRAGMRHMGDDTGAEPRPAAAIKRADPARDLG
ncbi:MAG: CDP-diacylglycerol--glycerol-3-phosphate 3-phosphatidyltransferase [Rhodospirillales bacterium]|nr:CDP-diacylglycerol--glycerol-3-phosphate 3-phosphatidyltransferase [Rhodospirillales bacterium]